MPGSCPGRAAHATCTAEEVPTVPRSHGAKIHEGLFSIGVQNTHYGPTYTWRTPIAHLLSHLAPYTAPYDRSLMGN